MNPIQSLESYAAIISHYKLGEIISHFNGLLAEPNGTDEQVRSLKKTCNRLLAELADCSKVVSPTIYAKDIIPYLSEIAGYTVTADVALQRAATNLQLMLMERRWNRTIPTRWDNDDVLFVELGHFYGKQEIIDETLRLNQYVNDKKYQGEKEGDPEGWSAVFEGHELNTFYKLITDLFVEQGRVYLTQFYCGGKPVDQSLSFEELIVLYKTHRNNLIEVISSAIIRRRQ